MKRVKLEKQTQIKRNISGEEKKDKMVKLKNSIHKRLRVMAAEEEKQISDLIEELMTTGRKLRD